MLKWCKTVSVIICFLPECFIFTLLWRYWLSNVGEICQNIRHKLVKISIFGWFYAKWGLSPSKEYVESPSWHLLTAFILQIRPGCPFWLILILISGTYWSHKPDMYTQGQSQKCTQFCSNDFASGLKSFQHWFQNLQKVNKTIYFWTK